MTDLFTPLEYPQAPGWKEPTTSKDAAIAIEPKAKRLRALVLADLRRNPASTADETAARIGESVLSVRPRFAELNRDLIIQKTGIKRRNESGLFANTWRVRA